MIGMGVAEILALLFMSGGGLSGDLATLLPAPSYFKSRNIDISVDKAMELAAKDPVDGKTQIAQLLALRWLADESAKLKASPEFERQRQVLTAIAGGKIAQDPQGFAKEYAAQVLARLDGTKLPTATAPNLRDDPFRWFPADAALLGAIDARLARGSAPVKSNVGEILKMLPEQFMDQAFGAIEKIGNVRIERVSFAYVESLKDQDLGEIYVRFTGKANRDWLLDGIQKLNGPGGAGLETEIAKGPQGETITRLFKRNQALYMAVIGDSDFVMAGFQRDRGDHGPLLDKVLELRGGKQVNAAQGALKSELAKIPEKACGLLVGRLPSSAFQGAPFPMPVMISGHMLRAQNALDVNLAGSMVNNDDAIALVKTISQFRQEGIDGLKKLQGAPIPVPGFQVGPMIQMLESMQVEANGSTAKLRVLLPEDVLSGAGMWFGVRAQAVAPPAKKEEEKK